MKVYTPRRVRERNRWLRSDGKPNFSSRVHEKPPELEPILRRDPPTATSSTNILRVCELMTQERVRLVPIVTPDNSVEGVVTGMDIIDFLGGGPKHRLVESRGYTLIYKVLDIPVGEIMEKRAIVADVDMKLTEVLELMIREGVGALPVVSKRGFEGVITERELMKYLAGKPVGVKVGEVMTKEVITVPQNITVLDAMKLMVETGVRRLPVTEDGVVKGIMVWRGVVDYVGTHKIFEELSSQSIFEFHSFPIIKVMRREVVTASEDMDLGDAAQLMFDRNVGSLLVTEDSVLKGIITERDIIYGLVAR